VIENAKEFYNEDTLNKLDQIIQVMHLGVDEKNIVDTPSVDYDKVIVFNHRTDSYKGWDRFIKWMEKYRETRQDFLVWVPLLDTPNVWSWVDTTKYDKETYYKKLSQCCVGVTPRQDHMGWSVSSTDSMMRGLPVLFQEQDCYREIMSDGVMFKDQRELFKLLDEMLDNKNFRMEWSEKVIEGARRLTDINNENIEKLNNLITLEVW
jgi:glycosyltransferase involved in cell wall biosynthesis